MIRSGDSIYSWFFGHGHIHGTCDVPVSDVGLIVLVFSVTSHTYGICNILVNDGNLIIPLS